MTVLPLEGIEAAPPLGKDSINSVSIQTDSQNIAIMQSNQIPTESVASTSNQEKLQSNIPEMNKPVLAVQNANKVTSQALIDSVYSAFNPVTTNVYIQQMGLRKDVVHEVIEKRTRNSKHYLLADGSYKAIISFGDLHYEDENGQWQDIQTQLVDEADLLTERGPISKESASEVNSVKQDLFKKLKDNKIDRNQTSFRSPHLPYNAILPKRYNKGYSIGKGKDKLSFTPIGASSVIGEVYNDGINYQNAWMDTDVSLQLQSDTIKETIIVKSPSAPTMFSFEVNGDIDDNLTAGELKILPAWLIDAKGEYRDVSQKIRRSNGKTFLDIGADFSGLTFPIIVDPSTTVGFSSQPTLPGQSGYNEIFIDTPAFKSSDITSMNLSYYARSLYFNSQCMCYMNTISYPPTNVYVTKSEYGTFPALTYTPPGNDGRDVVSLLTNSVSGSVISGDYIRSKVGNSTTIYGVAFWTPYNYVTDVVVTMNYAPSSFSPGSTTASAPEIVLSTPKLQWSFPQEVQAGYQVQIFNSTNVQVFDSGIVNLIGGTSFTVPPSVLSQNNTYYWKVRIIDRVGSFSDYSPPRYIKINSLPSLFITSYSDGQTLSDNMPTFTWTFSDADGQAQASYRIQGSNDKWATVGYDTGVISGDATSLQTPALSGGTWSFKITVYDGIEWSNTALRNNLIIHSPDTQAPTVPSKMVVTSKTPNSISLSWIASIDNIAVTSYKIYNGSTLLDSITSNSYIVQSLKANSLYILKVTAVDSAGNESKASNTQYVYTGDYQYHYDSSGRVDYIQFSSGQKLKYNFDANGNFLNAQLQ